MFTIEDEERGEGIQLHFYADSVARITTLREGDGRSDPKYLVEYSRVDGIDGYRRLVSAFVRGGCAALEQHGSGCRTSPSSNARVNGATPGGPSGKPDGARPAATQAQVGEQVDDAQHTGEPEIGGFLRVRPQNEQPMRGGALGHGTPFEDRGGKQGYRGDRARPVQPRRCPAVGLDVPAVRLTRVPVVRYRLAQQNVLDVRQFGRACFAVGRTSLFGDFPAGPGRPARSRS